MSDLTDGRNRNENVDPCCGAVYDGGWQWVCTRPPLHFGDHAAWADDRLMETWGR